jgi:thymidylate synthase ThyX
MPGYAHIGIFAPMEEIVRAGVDNLVTHHMNYDKRILKEEALRSYAQSNLNNDFSEYEKKLRKDGELKRAVLPLYHKKHFVYASVTS